MARRCGSSASPASTRSCSAMRTPPRAKNRGRFRVKCAWSESHGPQRVRLRGGHSERASPLRPAPADRFPVQTPCTRSNSMATRDILKTLQEEHDTLRKLFDDMKSTTDRAKKTRADLLD